MNNLIIKRSQLAEVQFNGTPAVGKKYPFTQIPNISRNNIMIYGFEVYTAGLLAVTPNNNTVIPDAAQNALTLTFLDNNNVERIYTIPYYSLIASLNGGFVRMTEPFILDLTKSYATIVDATNISTDEVAAVNLYYSIVGEN